MCSGCGLPKSETMDPEMHGRYEAVPLTCFACAERDAESRNASESRSKFAAHAFDGVYFAVQERGD